MNTSKLKVISPYPFWVGDYFFDIEVIRIRRNHNENNKSYFNSACSIGE